MKKAFLVALLSVMISCKQKNERSNNIINDTQQNASNVAGKTGSDLKSTPAYLPGAQTINTGPLTPQQLLAFAETLTGTPYKYGSTDLAAGFDCSGFITYVFNHFNIAVPRSSIDFTNVQTEIQLKDCKPGDLILFTGTDSTKREVGHMGIIKTADGEGITFIHSSSGKANGVTITPLNVYYMGRFMKVVRVFK